jgi:hypothetical protein
MTDLSNWKNYLSPEDFATLQEFVEKTNKGEHLNYYLVFYGTGCNGKSTLIR